MTSGEKSGKKHRICYDVITNLLASMGSLPNSEKSVEMCIHGKLWQFSIQLSLKKF